MDYLSSTDAKTLYQAFLALESEEECMRFLRDLLTDKEIKEFINRWKAAKMLHENTSYEEIEKETSMSTTTIARISKWLQHGMGGYQLVLSRQQDQKKKPTSTSHHTRKTRLRED